MSRLVVNNNNVVINFDNKVIIFNLLNNDIKEIEIPTIEIKSKQNKVEEERNTATSVVFSKCGKYLAVLSHKQLTIYNVAFEVIKNVTLCRSAQKIRFTPSGKLVIADKTGDAYVVDIQKEEQEPKQVLGHLSMLLDVLVTDCERFIITTDRDEKIRVSHFPNCYNIASFCLGHQEFVSGVEIALSDVIVSGSGDGTVRLWEFRSGKQLDVINTNEFIPDKSLVDEFVKEMDGGTIEVRALPVTNLKVLKTGNRIIIVVSLLNFSGLQVFELDNFHLNLIQILIIDDFISFDLSDKLFVLTKSCLNSYQFTDNFNKIENPELDKFFQRYKTQISDISIESILILYKKKFDNVQEYQLRKKLRIESKNKIN